MAAVMSPIGVGQQFFTNQGVVLSGGLIYTYAAGTTTPQATYTDNTLGTPNANPIVLDSSGRSSNEIWWNGGNYFKFILKDASNNTIATWDNIVGINDVSAGSTADFVASGLTPTYVSATSFTVVGNQTSIFTPNIRLKSVNTGGTIYSSVSSSSYSAPNTTVNVVNDSGVLDSGLSAVSYGFLNSVHTAMPPYVDATPVIQNAADATKLVKIDASGIATATTRTYKTPNYSGTLSVSTIQTLTDQATVAWDASLGANAQVTLTASRIMGAPSNLVAGAKYTLIVNQNGTGGWGLTWNAVYKGIGGAAMPQPALTATTGITSFSFTSPDGTNLQLDGSPTVVMGVPSTTTGGTAITFIGIPSGVKCVKMSGVAVSTSGSSNVQSQIGSGSLANTNYLSRATAANGSGGVATSTTGFIMDNSSGAGSSRNFIAIYTLVDATNNLWNYTSNMEDGTHVQVAAGTKTSLGGALDRISLGTVGGTDTFDVVTSLNIQYES